MILILDTETTGLQPGIDEILQLSIIDLNGKKVFDSYFKPQTLTSWDDAEKVNHITPEMVADAPSISDFVESLNFLFMDASAIVGYNINFDLSFLRAAGVIIPEGQIPVFDCMDAFAPIFGEWSEYHDAYKWQKLTQCAAYYHFDSALLPPDISTLSAHNSLVDCYLTRFVFYHICVDLAIRGEVIHKGFVLSDCFGW